MSRSHRASVVDRLRSMQVGDSACFVREVSQVPVPANVISRYSMLIGGYALRSRPGCSWNYEGFTCISTTGRVLTGTIVTLMATGGEVPALGVWRVSKEWYVNRGSAEKYAKETGAKLEAVPLPATPTELVALLASAIAAARKEEKETATLRQELETARQELAAANRLLNRYKRHISSLSELNDDE